LSIFSIFYKFYISQIKLIYNNYKDIHGIIFYSTHMQNKHTVFEASATSKKQIELATQRQADQAPEVSSNISLEQQLSFYSQHAFKLESKIQKFSDELKEVNDIILQIKTKMSNDIKNDYEIIPRSLNLIKKQERHNKKMEIQQDKQNRIESMSPTSYHKFEVRQKLLSERRQMKKEMTKEEKSEYKIKKQQERLKRQKKKLERKQEKLFNMTPEKLEKHHLKQQKKAAEKEAFLQITPEERQLIKAEKKAKVAERRARYKYLNQNWTATFPDNLGHLIIDGNNMRGGGPRRHSRDTIIKHINETIALSPELQNSTITVYFDHKPAKYEPIDGITVKFSGDVIADDLIVNETTETIKSKSVLVVTCDRLLALRLLDLNAHVMRNGIFNTINPNAPKRTH